jgi:hypothetical protein
MDYRVSYEHSLKNDPRASIVQTPSQLVGEIPNNTPRPLLLEYITKLILVGRRTSERSGILIL